MTAAVIAAAGCGGSSGSGAIPLSTATQSYQAARDGVITDHATVALDTPVLVEIAGGKGESRGTMEITVTSIDIGSWSDLGQTASADAEGNVPVYLRATLKNVGRADLPASGDIPDLLQGLLTDGGLATALNAFPPDEQCAPAFVTVTQFKPGTSYQTCTPVLASLANPVVAVQWINQFSGTRSIIWAQ